MRIAFAVLVSLLAASALAPAAAQTPSTAQNYPHRPIRMIVPFSPGGASDTAARVVSRALVERFGQQIVIDNRPRAAGTIGVELVAKAAADGYTLLMGSTAEIVVNPNLFPKLPYNIVRDLAPVSLVATAPFLVVVHPSVPAQNIKELIALARSKPDGLIYASSGNGGGVHLVTEVFKSTTGVKMRHIPFQGGAPGLIQTIAGETQVMFPVIQLALGQARAGKVRALAVTSTKRVPAAPEIPTVAESGVPGFDVTLWNGLLVPAAMPAPIFKRLYDETVRLVGTPEVKAAFLKAGAEATSSTSQEFATLIRAELTKYAKVIKDAGIKID